MRYILGAFFALRALAEPNSWQEITPVGSVSTPKRVNHMAMWSEVDDGFYVYGGRDENVVKKNDLHFYSRQSNSWAEIVPNGTLPTARQAQTAVWSNAADGFYVFGGCCWENDLHFYSREFNSWEKLSPAGTLPQGREGHAAVWGDAADGFYVCGGFQGSYRILDLHFYSRASNSWQRLSPSGSWPDGRTRHSLVWSEIDDGFYLFGGYSNVAEDDGGRWGTFRRNDLYLYSRQANSWQKLEPSGMPYYNGFDWETQFPSRRDEHAAVWSEQNDGFYVFGGFTTGGYYESDVHLYSRQRNEWQRLWPTGPIVMGRYQHAIVGGPEGFYVVGGRYSTSTPYDDLFLYTWQTTTTTTTRTSSTQTSHTSTSSTFTSMTMTSTTTTSSMTTLTISTSTLTTSTLTTLTHTSSTTTLTSTTATSTWTLTVQEDASVSGTCQIKFIVILACLVLTCAAVYLV